jgi:hypothetical protein
MTPARDHTKMRKGPPARVSAWPTLVSRGVVEGSATRANGFELTTPYRGSIIDPRSPAPEPRDANIETLTVLGPRSRTAASHRQRRPRATGRQSASAELQIPRSRSSPSATS